ncbi:CCR4-NOT transcription complex subunit 4 [Fistulifera solaris]|uniref:CCR4-NOT transcription complex subunit 4 n=1 Tax=Fistulifera solaris TaxID=1519565 RepID=A0A1Z5KAJ4_FISSO|nr:CCR4-NOT transcription complex subunit 4 [Fistulifera solaris]|eukprot:GAX23216.1 CCR4-NOT transcription complex subunit 4 [Fistulifera solaris]
MDDADHVCPLCCEELDLSDREFYPCKCGYQVCMWCWHRIRESESGLCPACRTPYGEDPHQFSAVDVEDVLKANKARDAALKRQKQQEGGMLSASQHDGVPNSIVTEDGSNVAMEVPKDRSQLANMRVIRRNLVYAVGLPASIASEDVLRKPEYFGQYGKIAKIVINRAISGEPGRRASASAYVTFVHKEDTLACILALDGFYLDNRNIRASYGTSKYCSAFIKSVRCNNPECTYLHEMGAAEDTFTKQEIQAGYVTSGRDVLARQQQIVSEQLRLNATSAVPRKRVGGGGPSGTGRASSSPVFPPPEFDEAPKPNPVLLPPPSGGVARAATAGTFSLNPSNISAKLGRSASTGNPSPTLGATAVPASAAAVVVPRVNKSAAAVVAGVHTVKVEDSPLHTTLTPLTPLKRAPKPTKSTANAPVPDDPKLPSMRVGKTKGNGIRNAVFGGSANSSVTNEEVELSTGPASIGGDVIAVGSIQAALLPGTVQLNSSTGLGGAEGGLTSALGGEVFTGPLANKPISRATSVDKWNSNQIPGAPVYPAASDLWSGMNAGPANSSSALASILGVDLPTGSGSLRENANIWPSSNLTGPSSLSALNSNSSVGAASGNAIGGIPMNMNSTSLIGGVPIGGGSMGGQGHIGGLLGSSAPGSGSYGGKSDIALLQSLLPGVHITSGSEGMNTSAGVNGWNQGGSSTLGGDTLLGWNSGAAPNQRSSVGAIGQGNGSQTQRQGQIW